MTFEDFMDEWNPVSDVAKYQLQYNSRLTREINLTSKRNIKAISTQRTAISRRVVEMWEDALKEHSK